MRNQRHNACKASALALGLLAAFSSPQASAASLATPNIYGKLGAPLRVLSEIRFAPGESVDIASSFSVRIAGGDAYAKTGARRPAWADAASAKIVSKGGKFYAEISTPFPVNDPAALLIVELAWDGGASVREFPVMLDVDEADFAVHEPTALPALPQSAAHARSKSGKIKGAKPSDAAPAPLPSDSPVPSATLDELRRNATASDSVATSSSPSSSSPAPTASVDNFALATKKAAPAPGSVSESVTAPSAQTLEPAVEPVPDRPAAVDYKAPVDLPKVISSKSGTRKTAESKKAAPQPTASERGSVSVRQGQTLSSIAASRVPAGASLDQTMVAIARISPDAFDGGNVNRLKSGSTIEIPSSEEALALSRAEASREIARQAAEWKALRTRAAKGEIPSAPSAQSSKSAKPDLADASKASAKASESKPSNDNLKLERAASGSAEDRVAKSRAAKEEADRLRDLEKTKANLQKLLEVQNKDLAAAAKAATGAKADPKAATSPDPKADGKPAAKAKDDASAKARADSDAKTADNAKPVSNPAADSGTPTDPDAKKAAAVPSPSASAGESEGGLGDYLALIVAAVGAAVGSAVHFAFKRKRKPKSSTLWRNSNSPASDDDLSPAERRDEHLHSAETFVTFNHIDRARSEIVSALEAMPEDPKALLALCSLEAKAKDRHAFESAKARLGSAVDNSSEFWAAIQQLSSDFSRPGFAPAPSAPALSPADADDIDTLLMGPASAAPAASDSAPASDSNTPSPEFLAELDAALSGSADSSSLLPKPSAASESAKPSSAPESFDFDSILGSSDLVSSLASEFDKPSAMDFDLPGDLPAAAPAASATPAIESFEPSFALPEADPVALPSFDLGDSLEAPPSPSPAPAEAPVEFRKGQSLAEPSDLPSPETDALELDLSALSAPSDAPMDFDLASFDLPAPVNISKASEPALAAEDDGLALDFGAILASEPPPAPAPETVRAAVAPAPSLEEDPSSGVANAEFQTMVDLADAYLEMGDREGAKEILAEMASKPGKWGEIAKQKLSEL